MTSDQENKFGIGFFIFVLVVVTALLFVGGLGSTGHDATRHVGPLPADVTRLSDTSYLVGSVTQPGDLCQGGTQSAQGATTVRFLPNLNRSFVECAVGQTFGFKPHKPRPNFWRAISNTVQTVFWIVPASILFLICFGPFLFDIISDKYEDRKFKKQHSATQEDRRSALAAAWAEGKIDDLQFNQGLDKILQEK